MSKQTEMSKVLAIVILILMMMGLGWCLVSEKELSDIWAMKRQPEGSVFTEQAALSAKYEQEMARKIVQAVEQLTGPETVRADVQMALNLTDEVKTTLKEASGEETQETRRSIMNNIQSIAVNVLIDGDMVQSQPNEKIYQPRSKKDMKQYEQIVKMIMGYQEKRGDQLNIQNVPFAGERHLIFGFSVGQIKAGLGSVFWSVLILMVIFGVIFPYLKKLVADSECIKGGAKGGLFQKVSHLCAVHPFEAAQIIKRWIRNGEKQVGFTAVEAAAVVILAVGQRIGKEILTNLREADIRKIGGAMARLGRVSARDVERILTCFWRDYTMPQAMIGNTEQVRELLNDTRDKGERILSEMALDICGCSVWDKIARFNKMEMMAFLKDKKPEFVAMVLSHLPSALAGQIMPLLSQAVRTRALIHLAHLKHLKPDVLDKMAGDVIVAFKRFKDKADKPNGADKVVDILKTVSPLTQEKWVEGVFKDSAEVGMKLKASLKGWADVKKLEPDKMRLLLKYVDQGILARALAIESDEVKGLFQQYIPERLYQEMSSKFQVLALQPDRAKEAQNLIVKTARYLKLF